MIFTEFNSGKSRQGKPNMYVASFPIFLFFQYAKSSQNADNDLWEANRMLRSGVVTQKTVDLDFEDESESTVHVMVHDLKPPFLDGRTVFTKQLDPINPIRDPTSDMAIFSKKGSALVKEKREQAERAKAAAKLAALGGTALGNIMGVKDEETEGASIFRFPLFLLPELHIHVVCLFPHFSFQPRQKSRKRKRQVETKKRIIRGTQSLPAI